MMRSKQNTKCNRRGAETQRNTPRKKMHAPFFSASSSASLRLCGCVSILILAVFAGCIGRPMNPAATQPVTITDTATTQPDYWYAAPSHGSAVYDSFATLFKTCENVSRDYGFKIDRVDYRTGILTTEGLVSAQAWEPWRQDVQMFEDSKRATMATLRRTVRYRVQAQRRRHV